VPSEVAEDASIIRQPAGNGSTPTDGCASGACSKAANDFAVLRQARKDWHAWTRKQTSVRRLQPSLVSIALHGIKAVKSCGRDLISVGMIDEYADNG